MTLPSVEGIILVLTVMTIALPISVSAFASLGKITTTTSTIPIVPNSAAAVTFRGYPKSTQTSVVILSAFMDDDDYDDDYDDYDGRSKGSDDDGSGAKKWKKVEIDGKKYDNPDDLLDDSEDMITDLLKSRPSFMNKDDSGDGSSSTTSSIGDGNLVGANTAPSAETSDQLLGGAVFELNDEDEEGDFGKDTGGDDEDTSNFSSMESMEDFAKMAESLLGESVLSSDTIVNIGTDDKEPEDDEDGGSIRRRAGAEDTSYYDFRREYADENSLHIPNRLGFSAVAWGDTDMGFKSSTKKQRTKKKKNTNDESLGVVGSSFKVTDIQEAYNKLMEYGILLLETSELYGRRSRGLSLSSEHIVGRCIRKANGRGKKKKTDGSSKKKLPTPIVATTILTPFGAARSSVGFRLGGKRSIFRMGKDSAERIGDVGEEKGSSSSSTPLGIYQVPVSTFYPYPPRSATQALSKMVDKGEILHAGVSDVRSIRRLGRLSDQFHKKSASNQLISNSFEFSLFNRDAWSSGLIRGCRDLGVLPLARNPLCGGLASGVYSSMNPTGGVNGGKEPFTFNQLEKWTTLHTTLDNVRNGVRKRLEREIRTSKTKFGPMTSNISSAQVAINYVVAKGCIPLPPVNNIDDANALVGCLGWDLTKEEVQMLDDAATTCERAGAKR